MGARNFAYTDIQTPNRPAFSESLYRHMKCRIMYTYLCVSQVCRQVSLFQSGDANMSLSRPGNSIAYILGKIET